MAGHGQTPWHINVPKYMYCTFIWKVVQTLAFHNESVIYANFKSGKVALNAAHKVKKMGKSCGENSLTRANSLHSSVLSKTLVFPL